MIISKLTLRLMALAISLILSCESRKKNLDKKVLRNLDVADVHSSRIIEKRLTSISKIIEDSINLTNKVVVIYNGFDCETCIDKAYEIAKRIDSLSRKQMTYIISTSANIGRDQTRNAYYNYVYSDEHDVIRRQLKYIKTPVMVKLDSSFTIKDVLFPKIQFRS